MCLLLKARNSDQSLWRLAPKAAVTILHGGAFLTTGCCWNADSLMLSPSSGKWSMSRLRLIFDGRTGRMSREKSGMLIQEIRVRGSFVLCAKKKRDILIFITVTCSKCPSFLCISTTFLGNPSVNVLEGWARTCTEIYLQKFRYLSLLFVQQVIDLIKDKKNGSYFSI